MQLRNTPQAFGVPAKVIHWLMALLIIGLIGLGWYMVGLDYYHPWYQRALDLHKGLGMAVLALAFLKLAWHWFTPPPPVQDSLRRWERTGARVAHHVLVAMMLLIPVTGYLISTSEGAGIDIFGAFEVPAVIPVGDTLRDAAIEVHYYCAYLTALVAAAHAGAALKHQFVDGHGTLRRML